MAKLFEV